jgi:large subunit ribosomal protein L18
MASVTSFLSRKAEIPLRTSQLLSVANMTTGVMGNEASSEFYNRNPRNLERLRIAYKPTGYHLEAAGREFWHKYVCVYVMW